jgi:tRNA threonylcarbamoyladenosine biosynthesis protein TsaB
MLVLAFDTSLSACSVALWRDGRVLARVFEPMERGHAEALVPMIAGLLSKAGLRPADADRIGVTVGPGTFTGIRIGLATAQGLGLACGRPVVGVTTSEAVARAVPRVEREGRALVVGLDAGRADLYVQCFGPDGGALGPVAAVRPGEHVPGLAQGAVLVAGNGSARLSAWLAQSGREAAVYEGAGLPDAAFVAEIAAEREPPETPPRPLYVHPTYARLPQAAPKPAPGLSAAPIIRLVRREEAGELAALHGRCLAPAWDEAMVAPYLEDAAGFALFAFPGEPGAGGAGAAPAGFLICRVTGDEAELLAMGVAAPERGRGLGSALLEAGLEEAARRGAACMFLEVAEDNAVARHLYERQGFRAVGRREGYYRTASGTVAALVLRRDL